MNYGGPEFVLSIIAMSFIAWIVTTAIRARHGYPIEDEWGKQVTRESEAELARRNAALEAENATLRAQVGKVEQRLAVLERIATDTPARLTAEIEKLR
jgi:cell division protein FtsB